jgi:hypothetical protein
MSRALTNPAPLWRLDGDRVALIRRPGAPAQKNAENGNTCGKKDTADLPQRGRGIKGLEL